MKSDAPELDLLFDAARQGAEPSAADRRRVTARVAQRLALGAGAGAVGLAVSRYGWAASLKTWAVAAVVAAGAGSTAYLLSGPSRDEHQTLTAPAVAHPPPSALRAPSPEASEAASKLEVEPAPPRRQPRRERALVAAQSASAVSASPAAALQPSSLARETAALREASATLRAGAPGRTLEQLDQLAQQFPHGMLAEEALATRISALCELGRVPEARTLGTRFLQRYPRSPVAARVRVSCAVVTAD